MEKQFYYQMQWPRDNLFISCYAHELFNYRYHWHDSDYEIDILLKGRAEFWQRAEYLQSGRKRCDTDQPKGLARILRSGREFQGSGTPLFRFRLSFSSRKGCASPLPAPAILRQHPRPGKLPETALLCGHAALLHGPERHLPAPSIQSLF